jgi:signal transduction histidine kinase
MLPIRKKNFSLSIFAKLFFVVFLTGIVLNFLAVVAFVLGARPRIGDNVVKNASLYAHYISDQFVAAKDRDKAQQLVKELGISVKVESRNWNWTNNPRIPDLSTIPRSHVEPPVPFNESPSNGLNGIYFVLDKEIDGAPAKIFVGATPGPILEPSLMVLAVILVLLTLVLILSFLVIVKILRPIQALSRGVAALSGGNFEHRVPIESNDEFALLANAFNSMTVRIRDMFQEKQQLLLDVSHELRSPVGRAQIALEILNDEKASARVSRELKLMERMIETMLDSARLEQGEKKLDRSLQDISELARKAALYFEGTGRQIAIQSDPTKISISVDPERITTVLKNLYENAIKYSPPGTVVLVSLSQTNHVVVVQVVDQGVGVPESETEKIFEPFYRVDKSRTRQTGGFGLGLSLCKRIIQAHGGKISARSAPNQGTIVEFSLPADT